jgi:hypothetical protein
LFWILFMYRCRRNVFIRPLDLPILDTDYHDEDGDERTAVETGTFSLTDDRMQSPKCVCVCMVLALMEGKCLPSCPHYSSPPPSKKKTTVIWSPFPLCQPADQQWLPLTSPSLR